MRRTMRVPPTTRDAARGARTVVAGRMRRTLALMLALVLASIVAACGHAADNAPSTGASSTTPNVGTATPGTALGPGPALAWRTITLPEPGQLIVAPDDGDIAYVYDSTGGGGRVWMTRDRGAHWSHAGDVPRLSDTTFAHLVLDATDPNVLVADVSSAKMGASPQLSQESALVSIDGGASWNALAGHQFIWQFASYDNKIYAAREGNTAAGDDVRNIWISDDNMRSWRVVGPPQTGTNPSFWLDQATGRLLALDTDETPPAVVRSDDGGNHWRPITVPASTQTVVATPAASAGDARWFICGAAPAGPVPGGTNQRNLLACSVDGGQTWVTRPALNLTQQSPKGFSFISPMDVFALTSDGSVLATVTDVNAVASLYRLPLGATAWQALGSLGNDDTPLLSASPGDGVVWQAAGSSATPTSATPPFETANLP